MKIINTEKPVKLYELIVSGDIHDKTKIAIYDPEGKYLYRGRWYEDKVLEYGECYGKAHKAGTGVSVMFRLVEP